MSSFSLTFEYLSNALLSFSIHSFRKGERRANYNHNSLLKNFRESRNLYGGKILSGIGGFAVLVFQLLDLKV